MTNTEFIELLTQKGGELFRSMPWRETTDPYAILVSELMLQQTQVDRVIPKFLAFMERFPTTRALTDAPLADVLAAWQGLGYNRRAQYLHKAAQFVESNGGVFPVSYEGLQQLPGVGPNTAGAILAYAFDIPVVYIETNIRTVIMHHFFTSQEAVSDAAICRKVDEVLPAESAREFYWAMMDYGSYLKRNGVRLNAKSREYRKQTKLEGSVRQVRGQIIRVLVEKDGRTYRALQKVLPADDRFEVAYLGLVRDSLIYQQDGKVYLTK